MMFTPVSLDRCNVIEWSLEMTTIYLDDDEVKELKELCSYKDFALRIRNKLKSDIKELTREIRDYEEILSEVDNHEITVDRVKGRIYRER